MKCPKCGFNSFEFLDSCKKCGGALTPFKQNHGIRPVILPSRQSAAPTPHAEDGPALEMGETEGVGADFAWEPSPEPAPAEQPEEVFAGVGLDLADFNAPSPVESSGRGSASFDTFSFEETAEPGQTPDGEHGKVALDEFGEFTDLLESSGSGGWSGEAVNTALGGLSAREFEGFAEALLPEEEGSGAVPDSSQSFGEFELADFTFEAESASPKKTAASAGETSDPASNGFDSLFDESEPDKR